MGVEISGRGTLLTESGNSEDPLHVGLIPSSLELGGNILIPQEISDLLLGSHSLAVTAACGLWDRSAKPLVHNWGMVNSCA